MNNDIKLPPHAIYAENSLIASMLILPNLVEEIIEKVPQEAFYNTKNRAIYEEIINLYDREIVADLIILTDNLKSIDDIAYYMATLIDTAATSPYPENSIQLVNDKYARRVAIALSQVITMQGCNESLSVGDICDSAETLNAKLSNFANQMGIKRRRRGKLVSVSDVRQETEDFYNRGFDQIGTPFKMWPKLSQCYRMVKGTLNVVSGIPGHGKTLFVDAMMVDSIINHGWKWAVFSPENKPYYLHLQPLSEKIVGKPFFGDGAMAIGEVTDVLNKLQKHIRFIEPDYENRTMKAIKNLALESIECGGVDGIVIDPWNKIELTLNGNESETQYIGRVLMDWQYFARQHNVFLCIVAHPTKMVKTPNAKYYPVPTLYNLSGGANWYNGVDNGLTIYRRFDRDCTEIHIQKIKFKNHGKLGVKYMRYNEFNGRLDEVSFEEAKQVKANPEDFDIPEVEIIEPELMFEPKGHYADEI